MANTIRTINWTEHKIIHTSITQALRSVQTFYDVGQKKSLRGTILHNVSSFFFLWHLQTHISLGSLKRISPVCPEFFRAERRVAFYFSGPPLLLNSLVVRSAIISARAHLISACHALSIRKWRPLFARLGNKTISPPALPDRIKFGKTERNRHCLRFY